MAERELVLDLLANDKTAQGTRSAARNLDDVADAADDAARSTEKLGRSSDDAAGEVGQLGRGANDARRHVERLDDQIGTVNQSLVLLAGQFAEAEDAASRLDISKGIRKAEAELRRLNKSRGILAGLIPDEPEPQQTQSFGRKLVSGIAAGVASAPASLATAAGNKVGLVVAAAAGAVAGPVLLSTMGSALAAGAGAGLLGMGISAAVAGDPGIQAAGRSAMQKFSKGLQESAGAKALRGPVLAAMGVLTDAGTRMTRTWSGAFTALSSTVVPLTRDVVQAGESINGALVRAATDSGPALDGLGDSMRLVADGAANFIDVLSDGGPEAAGNLRMIAGATGDLLTYSGVALKFFGDLANNPWVTGPLIPLLRKHYGEVAAESDDLAGSTSALADKMAVAKRAAEGERDALTELSKALKAETDPVFGLLDAQGKLKKAHEDVAEATKEHGAKSDEAKEALRKLATAALDVEGRAGALGDAFNGKMTPALRATLDAAGLSRAEINRLEAQFRQAKTSGDRFAKRYAASAVVNGVAQAKTDLYTLRNIANGIDGRTISIGMRITGVSNVSAAAAAIRKQYMSTGGVVDGPGTATSDSVPAMLSKGEYVVRASAVTKPGVRHLLERLNTGRMPTAAAGTAAPPAAAGTAVGGAVRVIVEPAPGASRAFMEMFRYSTRTVGE